MNTILKKFFTDDTMSVLLKQNTPYLRKQGKPGNRETHIGRKKITKHELEDLIDAVYSEVAASDDSFIEIDKRHSKVIQHGTYRIVIVFPPLSDGIEMTIVRPVVFMHFEDYEMSENVKNMLLHEAKGILVSGSPGSGKSTFAQSLAEQYVMQKKVVKTIEAPRDLQVPDEVTQYSFSHGSHDEIRDILLLSRPDYTLYDEVRNVPDFHLFKDLRLTGIGLLGVIHATRAIDSIQRFLGHIEMGVIPQVVDTVVYMDAGQIKEIYQLALRVKVPAGMMSEDLARPVIEVSSFFSQKIMYEIYTYGEQTMVIPLEDIETAQNQKTTGIQAMAKSFVQDYFAQRLDIQHYVTLKGQTVFLYVDDKNKGAIIGKAGEKIQIVEKELGLSVSVRDILDLPIAAIDVKLIDTTNNGCILQFPATRSNRSATILTGNHVEEVKINAQSQAHINQKYLVKKIQKRGFVVLE